MHTKGREWKGEEKGKGSERKREGKGKAGKGRICSDKERK